jgi:hypothetical protein
MVALAYPHLDVQYSLYTTYVVYLTISITLQVVLCNGLCIVVFTNAQEDLSVGFFLRCRRRKKAGFS